MITTLITAIVTLLILGPVGAVIGNWLGDFFKAESHSIYNRKDIKPFLVEVVNQAKKHMFD